jgi:hypothetical protein
MFPFWEHFRIPFDFFFALTIPPSSPVPGGTGGVDRPIATFQAALFFLPQPGPSTRAIEWQAFGPLLNLTHF